MAALSEALVTVGPVAAGWGRVLWVLTVAVGAACPGRLARAALAPPLGVGPADSDDALGPADWLVLSRADELSDEVSAQATAVP
ncbi:MAG TPA: hypothetical protein PLK19_06475 [Mycobacterium sp.]|nr:hypothetical protein [Mycobacterium sp.]